MWHYSLKEKDSAPVLVEGRNYEGVGLRKEQVIEHIRSLRALGY